MLAEWKKGENKKGDSSSHKKFFYLKTIDPLLLPCLLLAKSFCIVCHGNKKLDTLIVRLTFTLHTERFSYTAAIEMESTKGKEETFRNVNIRSCWVLFTLIFPWYIIRDSRDDRDTRVAKRWQVQWLKVSIGYS